MHNATCHECDTAVRLIVASDAPTGNPLLGRLSGCVSSRSRAEFCRALSVGRSVGVCVSSLLITDLISLAVKRTGLARSSNFVFPFPLRQEAERFYLLAAAYPRLRIILV